MGIFGGLKTLLVDHVIAGSLKSAAEGKYGPAAQKLYWWVEKNAIPISFALGGLDLVLKYVGTRYPQALEADQALLSLSGVFGLAGLTVGLHAADAPSPKNP